MSGFVRFVSDRCQDESLTRLLGRRIRHARRSSSVDRSTNPAIQDADFFFGRDGETGDIINKIITTPGRLIALVGNSGVGKSSLVQAGVIGSLKRQRLPGGQQACPHALNGGRAYAYLTMKPGEDPVGALTSEFAALWFPDPTDPKRLDRAREWAKRCGREPLASPT
jgi:hypothetical protein